MGELIAMEAAEYRRCREISRIVHDAEEVVMNALAEVEILSRELLLASENFSLFEMEYDVERQLELGEMPAPHLGVLSLVE